MLRTLSRDVVHHQRRSFRPPVIHKIVLPTTVCVKNPVTQEDEELIVNTLKEEALIDPYLRASDFSLEVQIRSGVDLKDCGRYFTPSTPEEYANVVSNLSKYLEYVQASVQEPAPIQESFIEPKSE